MRSSPGASRWMGPLRSASAGTPRLHPPTRFTNAHRCFTIISRGTRCYLSFLAPLKGHLPMFSRHDINSPKEARSLTDSPYWNLTDNDFVFAEAGAPQGVLGREMRYGFVFQNLSPRPLKINQVTRGMRRFTVVRRNYISIGSIGKREAVLYARCVWGRRGCGQAPGITEPNYLGKFLQNHTHNAHQRGESALAIHADISLFFTFNFINAWWFSAGVSVHKK